MVLGCINSLRKNYELVFSLARRSILERYKGSTLGLLWSFFVPITMLLVYTFVFGFIFKVKWGVDVSTNFPLVLFVGLMIHAVLAESLTSAPALVISQVNYVKKVLFPLECLAWVSIARSVFHLLISILILVVVYTVIYGQVSHYWLWLPLVLFPFVLFNLGVLWLLSSLGVYIRDISQLAPVLSSMLMFLCPIFYPLDAIPEPYQAVILLNPLTVIVEEARKVLIFNTLPDFSALALYTLFAYIFAQFSYIWFMRTKKGFADVL